VFRKDLLQESFQEVSHAARSMSAQSIARIKQERGPMNNDIEASDFLMRIKVISNAFEQEFDVVDKTCLKQLRKNLYCVKDFVKGGYCDHESYFFFVDGHIYTNDALLGDIFKARLERVHGVEILVDKLGETTFGSLSEASELLFGQPFLFVHRDGNCEHKVLVSEVMLPNTGQDVTDKSLYPMLRFSSKIKRTLCEMCGRLWARYQTLDDGLSGDKSSSKLCSQCFRICFYDADGKLYERHQNLKAFPLFPGS